MRHRPNARRASLWAAALLLATTTLAQVPTGNVFGSVVDTDDDPIGGATVTLSGLGADRTQITDERGQFRFLAMDPGSYTLTALLQGFSSTQFDRVEVSANRNTTVPLVMQSAVQETLTVSAESPLLDERQLEQGTSISQTELEKIPTARDPWALLHQTPGVLVDKVNVGGSESGQQSTFRAPGVDLSQNHFLLDGVSVTDMGGIGGLTSTYFDFDQLTEINYSTGGNDVTKGNSGVSVSLVTKRGSNEFRGSARFFNTKAQGYFGGALRQAQPNVSGADMGPGQSLDDYEGAQIREIEEMGFEAGGALLRDRMWLWGSWGQNDIQQNAPSGTADDTILENTSLKLNAQLSQANSFVASWNNGDKLKFGRGAGISRPDITTWNQRGPATFYRFEDSHVFSSSFFLTGTYALGKGPFYLAAKGGVGPDAPEAWRSASGIWQDNMLSTRDDFPSEQLKLDASYFLGTGSINHEIRVGGQLRRIESDGDAFWPGRNIYTYNTVSTHFVVAKRGISTPVIMDYLSLWAQDTLSLGRLTVNAGLRFDNQSGTNDPGLVPANPMVPNVLPAIDYSGSGKEFDWQTLGPRVGITYALGSERQTLVRASLAQFADQLRIDTIRRTNPAGDAYAYFFLSPYEDAPYTGYGSALDDPARVDFAWGFDPTDPTALESPSENDPDLDAPVTTELIVGVEHAVLPELVIGLNATVRKVDDILEYRDFIRLEDGSIRTATRGDYVLDDVLTGTIPGGVSGGPEMEYATPIYALAPGRTLTGGDLLTNGSRSRDYLGAALTFTKRLTNQWMLRGYLNYGKAEWNVPQDFTGNSYPGRATGGGDRDGDLYIVGVAPAGKGTRFLQSTWTANLNGLYQIAPDRPWGFNFAGSIQAREGYPIPYFACTPTSDGLSWCGGVLDRLDTYRLGTLFVTDLRLEKEFNVAGPLNMTFGIDAFNITNEGTDLSRGRELTTTTAYWLYDNVSPRIYRLSVRLSWR